jgi:hypothetical protein
LKGLLKYGAIKLYGAIELYRTIEVYSAIESGSSYKINFKIDIKA